MVLTITVMIRVVMKSKVKDCLSEIFIFNIMSVQGVELYDTTERTQDFLDFTDISDFEFQGLALSVSSRLHSGPIQNSNPD